MLSMPSAANAFDAASDSLLAQLDSLFASDDSESTDDYAAEVAAWEEANRLARCGGTGRVRKFLEKRVVDSS